MSIKGIDVSEWNTGINYAKVAKQIDFVIPREGYREKMDKMFLTHVTEFKKNGVDIDGVYHFIYAYTTEGVKREARSCIANIQKAGLPKTIKVWADYEYDSVKDAAKYGVKISASNIRNLTKAFCDEVKRLGYSTGIYTNVDYYKNYYGADFLKDYDIWLADYSGSADYPCLYHQYTSTGKLDGYANSFDMNYYLGKVKMASETHDASEGKVAEIIKKAVTFMVGIANDNSHGYDQIYRWGEKGDYDCSSLVITSFERAGVPVKTKGASYTGNMKSVFLKCGFKDVTNMVNLNSGAGLQYGDVLLNEVHHTALYIGDGKEVEASINENGGARYGRPGDQTMREILVRNYRNYPWTCVLRFTDGKAVTANTSSELKKGSSGSAVKTLQTKLNKVGYALAVDGDFGEKTKTAVLSFQRKYGLVADGIVGPKTSAKLDSVVAGLSPVPSSVPSKTPKWVGKVTASTLNVRSGAGTSYVPIKSYPTLSKGNLVDVCDSQTNASGKWYYIRIAGQYFGFVSANYIEKA